ncbi:HEAT repeat domain-containing protein [Myxococcota bacterium]|nr:HEAT repeat domain-containing protein [Myxococcota bacterium]
MTRSAPPSRSALCALVLLPWMGGPAPAQPVAPTADPRQHAGPDRAFDLQQLDLDLRLLPAERAVEGTATYTVRRLWRGPAVLDQVALEIREVHAGGAALPWRVEGETLVVDLPEDFAQAGPGTFSVSWRATPRTGLHFREGGRGGPDAVSEVWSQGEGEDNRHWFPGWDHPGDRFVYQGQVQAPDGWQAVTNSGVDLVNYLVMVAAGPYEVVSHPQDPGLSVWLPPGTDRAALSQVLDPLPAMMDHLASRTGVPYPWGPYRQVFVQRFLYTGMENTSATIQHERMLGGARVQPTRAWVESVVAHELAHQWYGDLLTCEDWRELWLNEGFATFFAADWMATRQGPEAHAAEVQGWLDGMVAHPRPLAGRFFHGPDAAMNANVYGRGAGVLHMLRVHLGEERFWAGIRAYTQGHQRGLVATVDLQRAMEGVSGRNLDWFFQQWVELGATPKLQVRSSWAEGRLGVVVHQEVDPQRPRLTLPVTVEVGTSEGATLRREGWLEDEELTLELELDQPPRWVAFDPDGGLAATVDHEQDPAAWQAQLSSPSPLARRRAIQALGRTDQSAALVALLADASRPLAERVVAAQALGDQRATAPLIEALRDPQDRLRQAAATALGRAADTSPAGPLRKVAEGDKNPDVRAAALEALAAVQPGLALPVARALVRRGVDRDERVLRQAAARVVGEHGDPTDLAALLDPRWPERQRNDGLSAAGRIVARAEGQARDRLAARVARAAEPLLDDLDLRTRQHAIGVLAEVGDPTSVNHLERYRRAETVSDAAAAAQDAITAIRSRQQAPPAPQGLQDARLQELEERLDALEGELERAGHKH